MHFFHKVSHLNLQFTNKKTDLTNPKVCQAEVFLRKKPESGGEGNRTPVLDTVDASISMFRRGLLHLAGDPLRVSLSP